MTIPAGNDSDDTGANGGGTAVATTGTATGIDPFLAAAAAGPDVTARRTFKSMILDYSAHAAMIVGLIGFAWTVSDHVVTRQTAAQIEAPAPVKVADIAKPNEAADLRRANQQMADDIKSLRANIDTLRTSIKHDRTPEQVRALAESLEGVKTGLTSTKTETNTAIAQLTGKIEKLQHDPNSKIQQLVDRLGKMEHQPLDNPTTGSIAAGSITTSQATITKTPPVPPSKPASVKLASIEDGRKATDDGAPGKQQVLAGWVVRDVYDGVAIVQGRHGSIEVVPGVSIPGAGTVKSIERRGAGWTVTTTKGQMAYAAPARDYRRGVNRDFGGNRDFYPDDRYDF
jgi:hypothetical protein